MTTRYLRAALAALLLALPVAAPTPAAAADEIHVIVLRDGRSIRARSWEVRDNVVHLIDEKGEKIVVRKDLVDIERTRRATDAARRTPTPTPTPRPKSIVELSREMQEKRRRGENQPLEPITSIKMPSPPPVAATPVLVELATPPPVAGETPVAATTEPVAQETPAARVTPTPAVAATVPPLPPPGPSPLLLYGGIGLGVAVVAGVGAFFALRRKPAGRRAAPVAAGARGAAVAAAPAESGDDLLTPAFAHEGPAEDLPSPAELPEESFSAPAELSGTSTSTRALPEAPPEVVSPGILVDAEIQIRISGDVYTCPNLASLKKWVEEGRVIENSEVLAPDGSWLMAGTIPDLEQAFTRRRETLGY